MMLVMMLCGRVDRCLFSFMVGVVLLVGRVGCGLIECGGGCDRFGFGFGW